MLSLEESWLIVFLVQFGYSYRNTASLLSVNHKTVAAVWHYFLDTGTVVGRTSARKGPVTSILQTMCEDQDHLSLDDYV